MDFRWRRWSTATRMVPLILMWPTDHKDTFRCPVCCFSKIVTEDRPELQRGHRRCARQFKHMKQSTWPRCMTWLNRSKLLCFLKSLQITQSISTPSGNTKKGFRVFLLVKRSRRGTRQWIGGVLISRPEHPLWVFGQSGPVTFPWW